MCLTVVYLIAFAARSFLHPFRHNGGLEPRGPAIRLYVWDALLLMLGLYLLTLVVEALGRRLRALALWRTASLVLAALLAVFCDGVRYKRVLTRLLYTQSSLTSESDLSIPHPRPSGVLLCGFPFAF